MSRLKNLIPKPIDISLEDGSTLSVRPLSLKNISLLLDLHSEEVKFVLSQNFETMDWASLLIKAPTFVADIISLAADEFTDEGRSDALLLATDLQIEIVLKIWKASFPTPKKLQQLLAEALGDQG